MTYETVRYEVAGGVHRLVLNRPERMNAINERLIQECCDVMQRVATDPSARVLVLSGEGRGFCAGADVSMMDATLEREQSGDTTWGSDEIRQKLRMRFQVLTRDLYRLPVPTVAVVRGAAVGGGMDLACACDIVIGSERARFMVAYTRRGLFQDLGGFWLVPRVIGYRKAVELVYTARFVESAEAESIGLLTRRVPESDIEQYVEDLVSELAERPAIALRLGKLMMQRTQNMEMETAFEMGAIATTITETSDDFRESITAFVEKREPQFRGR
jgi:2-(1,2-epoxy-1,2-dihydrophenyl)acetyl-CoA isomerase